MKYSTNSTVVKSVLGLAALLAVSSTVIAQKQHRPPEMNKAAVLDQLNLDDNARQSLETILDQQKAKMDELHQTKQEDRYQAHLEKHQIHESNKEEVKAVLSEEQFAAFEKAMWEQRYQRKGQGKRMMQQRMR